MGIDIDGYRLDAGDYSDCCDIHYDYTGGYIDICGAIS